MGAADPRIVFAGTPEFAVPSLAALHAAGADIVTVYTQPDRRAGRGRRPTPPPVKRCAAELGLVVRQPERIHDDLPALRELAPDLLVVVAYGQILSREVLAVPRVDSVNVHASLLPRWRGAAPIQRALEAGDAVTGVSIMRVVHALDAGPVFAVRETPIGEDDTAATLHDRLARLGAEALVAALPGIAAGSLPAREQDPSRVCYAARLDKAEARVDWGDAAAQIARRIRAFNPWPVCTAELDGATLRLWHARSLPAPSTASAPPGTVVAAGAEGIDVVAGDGGIVRITRLQAEGRRPLPAADFVNARPLGGARLR